MNNEDWNDIKTCLTGNTDAYKHLVERYEEPVTRLMWRFSSDRNICEMLVQDVFIEAYYSLKTYKGNAPFLHWLKKIGTRTGYRFWKQREKENRFLPIQDFDFIENVEVDSIDHDQAAEILNALLSRLPADDRLVLTLMYFENCSIKEISKQTGWSESAVKSRAMRARNKIKAIAEKENILEKLGWTL